MGKGKGQVIVAFDLATQTGVAIGRPSETPRLFTEKLGSPQGKRFAQAMIMARRILREVQPDLVVVEAPIVGAGGKQTNPESSMGIRACVLGMCYIENVPVKQLAVQTVRKHFVGHGGLKRADAKLATLRRCKQLGWAPKNDDEADAAALWDLACATEAQISTHPSGGLFDR